MILKIETVEDLIKIIEEHPEWRQQLRKALYPELDVPKAFQELAEAQKSMMAAIERLTINQEGLMKDVATLKSDVAILKSDVATLKSDVATLKSDVGILKSDVAILKGSNHELFYERKAASVFGRYIRRGRDMTNEVADALDEATNSGVIAENEFRQVLAADLLWGGRLRRLAVDVILVLEASWRAEVNDVERAKQRADILARIGFQAIPVVGGKEWAETAVSRAQELHVVRTTNGQIDSASWDNVQLVNRHDNTAI